MSALLWILLGGLGILLGVLYLTALFLVGLAALRKGHTVLFFVGIVFPFLWIVGALMEPTRRVATAEARKAVQRR